MPCIRFACMSLTMLAFSLLPVSWALGEVEQAETTETSETAQSVEESPSKGKDEGDENNPRGSENRESERGDGSTVHVTSTDTSPLGETASTTELAHQEPSHYTKLFGRIWRVQSGFVFARTPIGTLTLFSKKGLRNVKSGLHVTVSTHDNSVVVDIHKKGDPTPLHRFITGTPVSLSPDDNRLQLWTPEGGYTVPVTHGEGQSSAVQEGVPVTLQLNHSSEIVRTTTLNLDIQINNGTAKRPGTKMKLAGTVLRVNAGIAFIETPIGILLLSKNTGFRKPRAGQEVTVWLDEDHLAIDVKPKDPSAPSHRYITSKVVYVTDTRKEIRLWTPEGEKTVSLPEKKSKKRAFRPGTPVTVQLNAEGQVVDVRRAS